MIIKKELKNGLEVYFNISKKNNYSSIMMSFDLGWMHDDNEFSGLAHLFEHLVGKRTKTYPEKGSISLEKSKLGITYNAMTTPDNTYYYQNSLTKHYFASLNLLLQSIYESVFDENDLEGEKKIVLREYANYQENRQQYMWETISKNIFKNSPLSKNIFGTQDSLKNIEINTFKSFYDNYKNIKKTKLLISTDNEELIENTIQFLEDYFAKNIIIATNNKELTVENYSEVTNLDIFTKKSSHTEITKPGKTQTDFAIVFTHNKLNSKEQICYEILYYILVTSWSSIFFKKLRDELSLVYEIVMQNYNYQALSFTYLNMSTKKEDVDVLKQEATKIINEIEKQITTDMLYAAKNIWEFYYISNASPFKKNNEIRNTLRLNNNIIDDIEKENLFEEINIEDIVEVSKKIFGASPSYIQIS